MFWMSDWLGRLARPVRPAWSLARPGSVLSLPWSLSPALAVAAIRAIIAASSSSAAASAIPPFAGNAAGDSTLILAFAFALPTLAASASASPVIELSLNSIPRGPGSQRSGPGPDWKSTRSATEIL